MAKQPEDEEVQTVEEDYTVFSKRQRWLIIILLGIAMLTSPLTVTMYLPLLPLLATKFHTSLQAINLTITVYVIFQALSPVILSSPSDHFGRRPIYLFTFSLYVVASLGLALNKSNYGLLVVLRAIQSLGASNVLSMSYGTVADITVQSERGKMLGPMLAAGNLGTCIGPIFGGLIAYKSGIASKPRSHPPSRVINVICLSGNILNYAFTAEKIGLFIDKRKGDDLAKFAIDLAGSRGCTFV